MYKIIYIIFIFFSTSQAFGNTEQIIPNGIYEFIWKVQYTEEGTSDLLANDYVEIIDDRIEETNQPYETLWSEESDGIYLVNKDWRKQI